jgi:hypothetical protein
VLAMLANNSAVLVAGSSANTAGYTGDGGAATAALLSGAGAQQPPSPATPAAPTLEEDRLKHLNEQKAKTFKEQAAKQRDKIKALKGADPTTLETAVEPETKPLDLTEANLKAQQ